MQTNERLNSIFHAEKEEDTQTKIQQIRETNFSEVVSPEETNFSEVISPEETKTRIQISSKKIIFR